MKALRTKVILSGIVLVFAFIATIGTTFAWFTVSQTATVEEMTLNISAEDSLLIQVDGFTEGGTFANTAPTEPAGFQTTISVDDFVAAGYTSLESYRLKPLTIFSSYATPAVSGSALYDNVIGVGGEKTLVQSTAINDATNGTYIELRLWLYFQGVSGATAEILFDQGLITQESVVTSGNPENAARLSVMVGSTNTYVFGNTKDFGFSYGIGDDGYVGTTETDTAFNSLATRTTALVDGSGILIPAVVEGDEFVQTFTEANDTTVLAIINANTATLVTVKIFVEGWASATTDAIINSAFNISFGFKIGTVVNP